MKIIEVIHKLSNEDKNEIFLYKLMLFAHSIHKNPKSKLLASISFRTTN